MSILERLQQSVINGETKTAETLAPQAPIAAYAMKAGLTRLRPHLAEANVQAIGKEN